MKKRQNILLFLSFLLILVVVIVNFSAERVTGKSPDCKVKRGYIFDRNLHPIAISLENYKAYYFLKDNSFLSPSDIKILKKYLGSTLNLSKKGVILLSKDLSMEEVKKLKNNENVIIERTFKRKILQPYLKPLIGETFNGYGISGVEKVYDKRLRMGKPLVLSIDLNLEKRIYNIINCFNPLAFGVAVVNLETGELLSYLESENVKLFENYYPLKFFGISPKEIKDFNWIMGNKPVIRKNNIIEINIWNLAEWFMDKACRGPLNLTVLPRKTRVCQPDVKSFNGNIYIYPLGNTFITIAFKRNRMLVSSFVFNSEKAYALNQKLIKHIYSVL